MKKAKQAFGTPATTQSSIESRAIYKAFIGGGVGFGVGILLFWNSNVALFERGISLGSVGSILSGIAALVMYLVATMRLKEGSSTLSWWGYTREHISTVSLALVHGLLVFLSYALLFYLVSESFKDAHIDMWAASLLLALSTAFASYITYLSAVTMTAVRVSALLALFLLSGTFISMLTASNPHWWNDHFSSLGAGGDLSGYTFNGTLIIAGLVIVALSGYITQDFNKLRQGGYISRKAKTGILQALLTSIGIALAFVGLFVYNEFPTIHNIAAGGMAFLFLGIVILLPFLTPGFSAAFFVASYSLLSGLLAGVWLFSVHYFNLTVFELVAAAIIFTWLVVFVRHVAALLDDETVNNAPAPKQVGGEK